MKKTIQVHEFDPVIYPRKIWITTSKNSYFEGFEELPVMDKSEDACVCLAKNTARNLGGIFIRFDGRKSMTTSNIAHESVHAALEIFDYVNARIEAENQEPFAYLVGFIADCCEQVKKNRIKDL